MLHTHTHTRYTQFGKYKQIIQKLTCYFHPALLIALVGCLVLVGAGRRGLHGALGAGSERGAYLCDILVVMVVKALLHGASEGRSRIGVLGRPQQVVICHQIANLTAK